MYYLIWLLMVATAFLAIGNHPCQIMALRSAVDLLCGAYSADEAEATLGDYRFGGNRHDIAQSLYQLIDNL